MNVHHLELFYYVARHGGVSAAARRIPYGIQQPAISAQIIQLENHLGTTLFHRRPFQLTSAGEELFRFIEPFFGNLEAVGQRLRGGVETSLRIGAIETVHREYLPRLLKKMRSRFPGLGFTLLPARMDEIEAALQSQEMDLGVGPLLDLRSEGIHREEILAVPMALMVPEKSPLKSASELWQKDRIDEPLIAGRTGELVYRVFQRELQARKVEWFASIELSSQELITRYVLEEFGIGLVLVELGIVPTPGVRILPLEDFPRIPYGVVWTGMLSPVQEAFVEEAKLLAGSLAASSLTKVPARKARTPAS